MKPISDDEARIRVWVELNPMLSDMAILLEVINDLRSEIREMDKSVRETAARARAAAEREMMATREIWAAIRKAADAPMGIGGGALTPFGGAYLCGRREAVVLIRDLAEAELRRSEGNHHSRKQDQHLRTENGLGGNHSSESPTAAEINAERIAAIVTDYAQHHRWSARAIARKIVEAFPELRPQQQTSERDGSSRVIVRPVPWMV